MPDYTADADFNNLLNRTKQAIDQYRLNGVADAQALVDRHDGDNNLTGHELRIVPLAVWFAMKNQGMGQTVRNSTDLNHNMGTGSHEARNANLWDPIKTQIVQDLNADGHDVITVHGMKANTPTTAREVATTYLNTEYGGGQIGGGAGNTVLKRTLKLMAHDELFT